MVKIAFMWMVILTMYLIVAVIVPILMVVLVSLMSIIILLIIPMLMLTLTYYVDYNKNKIYWVSLTSPLGEKQRMG